ncbi:MAG: hypothetical protein GX175_08160 [Halanaerobiaceae bacterium]|nr:hypothetical protein [Halanaerobiaceae bacterium]
MENIYQTLPDNFEEIELKELLLDIWNNKKLICIVSIIFILISAIYNFFIADTVYECSSEIYTNDFTLINGNILKSNEYISFFNKPGIKGRLIEKYNFDIGLDQLEKKLIVTTSSDKHNTVLTLRETDNVLAVDLLNDWVKFFIEEVRAYINNINRDYINNLERIYLEREASYMEANKALTELNKNTNLELLKSRLSRDISKLVELENSVLVLKNEISVLTEKKKLLEEQIDRTDKFIVTNETLDDSSMEILLDLLEGSRAVKSLIIEKEHINTIYISLQDQLNQTEIDLANKTQELQLTINNIDKLGISLASLKAEIALLEDEKELLQLKVSETKKNYENSRDDYYSTQLELEKLSYNIPVIREAVVPESPVRPRKMLNLTIAAVLGVFLSIFIIFIKKCLLGND